MSILFNILFFFYIHHPERTETGSFPCMTIRKRFSFLHIWNLWECASSFRVFSPFSRSWEKKETKKFSWFAHCVAHVCPWWASVEFSPLSLTPPPSPPRRGRNRGAALKSSWSRYFRPFPPVPLQLLPPSVAASPSIGSALLATPRLSVGLPLWPRVVCRTPDFPR